MIRLDATPLARKGLPLGRWSWPRCPDPWTRAKSWPGITIVNKGGYEPWNMDCT